MNTRIIGKNARPLGKAPAIVLVNPKFGHNVGMIVRLASCYGLEQVWFTGDRVTTDLEARGRLPREERMKGYADVELINYDYPFEQFTNATPIAVEVRKNSERLWDFEHPVNPVYVFGPEDGSIPKHLLSHCHRFLIIPTLHCLNLATAAASILGHRECQLHQAGLSKLTTPGDYEERGFIEMPPIDNKRQIADLL